VVHPTHMARDEDPPLTKPTRLRGVAGTRTDKRPPQQKRTARLLKTPGPSGTMRDGRVVFQTSDPLWLRPYTMHWSISVEDLLLALDRLRLHLEESMDRTDDRLIVTDLRVGIESRVLPGANPHLHGAIQVVPISRKPQPDEEGEK